MIDAEACARLLQNNDTGPSTIEHSISILTRSDANDIARLQTDSWAYAYKDVLAADYIADGLTRDIAKVWSAWDDAKIVLGARDGQEELVGFAAYIWRDPVYLDNFHIAKAHHGTGLAAMLFDAGLAKLAARGANTMYLTVLAENERARAFYSKMGGIERDPIQDDMLGNPVSAIPVYWDEFAANQKNASEV